MAPNRREAFRSSGFACQSFLRLFYFVLVLRVRTQALFLILPISLAPFFRVTSNLFASCTIALSLSAFQLACIPVVLV